MTHLVNIFILLIIHLLTQKIMKPYPHNITNFREGNKQKIKLILWILILGRTAHTRLYLYPTKRLGARTAMRPADYRLRQNHRLFWTFTNCCC